MPLGYATSHGETVKVYKLIGDEYVWDESYDDTGQGRDRDAPINGDINHAYARDLDWGNIPPRPWVAGTRLLRGFVTALTGPGGVGKTALTITQALSFALNRNLLDPSNADPVWRLHGDKPLRTYVYGLEDDLTEMQRRFLAVMNFHGIKPTDVGDTLVLGDGSVDGLILALSRDHKLVRTEVVDKLIATLRSLAIDILILDPFVKLHCCNENDNGKMDFLMVILKEIAIKSDCAIWIIHHSGKDGTTVDAHGSRGASSIVAAARVSETLTAASKADREAYGFGSGVVKLQGTKANMSAVGDGPQWLRLGGHPVGNGDFAQVIERVDAETQAERMDAVMLDAIAAAMRDAPDQGFWVSKRGAPTWIGRAFRAGGVGTDGRADSLAKDWLSRGLLIPDTDAKDSRGREVATAVKPNEALIRRFREMVSEA